MATMCSWPARFGFWKDLTTVGPTAHRNRTGARFTVAMWAKSPTTAAEAPVSMTCAASGGSPHQPGPAAIMTRALSVPASETAYATTTVRAGPSNSWASATPRNKTGMPGQAGRSRAGTNRESGVRSTTTGSDTSPRTCEVSRTRVAPVADWSTACRTSTAADARNARRMPDRPRRTTSRTGATTTARNSRIRFRPRKRAKRLRLRSPAPGRLACGTATGRHMSEEAGFGPTSRTRASVSPRTLDPLTSSGQGLPTDLRKILPWGAPGRRAAP